MLASDSARPEECEVLQCLAAAAAAAGCLNALNARGKTPLALAIFKLILGPEYGLSCLEHVRVLLAAGADPNAAEFAADTPLMLAVTKLQELHPDAGGSDAGLQILQLLLAAEPQPPPAQVKAALRVCLQQERGYAAAAHLLLHLQKADGSAVDAMREVQVRDPAAMRLALLQGWAAAVAEADAERAALVSSQGEAAAVMSGFREVLLGVAALSKK
jgi:hypothetical protein